MSRVCVAPKELLHGGRDFQDDVRALLDEEFREVGGSRFPKLCGQGSDSSPCVASCELDTRGFHPLTEVVDCGVCLEVDDRGGASLLFQARANSLGTDRRFVGEALHLEDGRGVGRFTCWKLGESAIRAHE